MSIKRKEQLKNAQKRYRERHQWDCSRINLFIAEKAHQILKDKARHAGLTQASYLEELLLNNPSILPARESKTEEWGKEVGQGVIPHLTESTQEVSDLSVKMQQMQKELEKKNYWIGRLTAINEALNHQNQELERRIQQFELISKD